MRRQTIASLTAQQSISEIYRVVDKQLRANRQGSLYLLLQLSDATGMVSAMRWNANQALYDSFQKGEFLHIEGTTQLFNGQMQVIVNHLDVANPNKLDMADFDQLDQRQVEKLWNELLGFVSSMSNSQIKAITTAFAEDATIRRGLQTAPAGVKTHHAVAGGLLDHVVSLMRVVDRIASNYPQVDRDLLMAGAMLHDIGKIEELAFEGELTYTDAGQLVGHLVQGVQILQRIVTELRAKGHSIDQEIVWRIEHMIVSHHGTLEHGSPRVPMTLEAIMLHAIDDLDAKLNAASELIDSDKNGDSRWTAFNPTMGRKLFKPSFRRSN
jgi:3'-5' exoribonuclease